MATNTPNVEPGESEFSHGRGLIEPVRTGATSKKVSSQEFFYPEYEVMAAIRRTDPADAEAVADFTAEPGTASNQSGQKWVREA